MALSEVALSEGKSYEFANAIDILSQYDEEVAVICLDDAWARPYRGKQFGVKYPTHPFQDDDAETTTVEILDACEDALVEGGWLIADVDDWLLPRILNYLTDEWGDVTEDYSGGGYRKVGGVTYMTQDGTTPDRSTAGMYLSNGGYHVVFAHKGETTRRTSTSARQVEPRQRNQYEWGSVKPINPYQRWLGDLLEPEELLVVPCAGTAPAALAAELEYGDDARYVCIDTEVEAYHAFVERAREVLPQDRLDALKFDLDKRR
jgi:hypothetical protein